MTRNPTFRQLQVFVQVVQTGAFGAAGRALGISQYAVSKHMQALERAVGEALFLREKGRSVKLTPRGELLAGHAAILLRDSSLVASVTVLPTRPNVVVGAGEMLMDKVFYPSLHGLYSSQPDLEVRFEIVRSALSTIPTLGERGIDVAFLLLGDTPEFVSGRHLGKLAVGIFASPGLIAALGRDEAMPVLSPVAGGALDRELGRYMVHDPIRRFERARAAQTGGAALDLALHGHGACCIPTVDAAPHVESGKLVQLDRLPPLHAYSFLTENRRDGACVIVEEYFAALMVKYFALC